MGKSGCIRHPNHNHLPGICPSCLRERLQQFQQSSIYSDSASTIHSFSSSSSDFFFSGDSPRRRNHHHHHHRRNASEMVTGSTADKLKKSGSMGILAGGGGVDGGGGGKKKSGFWSRLLIRPKGLYFHSHPKVSSTGILG